MITSFHGAHVLTGVIVLLVMLVRTLRRPPGRLPADAIESAGLFWHFVDLVWILVFTFVYLIPPAPGGAAMSQAAGAIARSFYLQVFALLTVLTAAEIGVVYVPGIARGLLIAALVLLALAKAALVLLFFMHLRDESRGLRLTVLIPFALPAVFAAVLMAEAAWRVAAGVAP